MLKRMMLCGTMGCGLLIALIAAPARGDGNDTSYSYYYLAQPPVAPVAPNSTFKVPLYLEEVNSDGSSNSLIASEKGIYLAGVEVAPSSGSALNIITAAAPNLGSVPHAFDDPGSSSGMLSSAYNPSFGSIVTDGIIIDAAMPTDTTDVLPPTGSQSDGISEILLGTITLKASSLGHDTTTFEVGTSDPVDGSTFTNLDLYNLDTGSDPGNDYADAAPSYFSVTTSAAVPEPAAFSLLGLSMLAGLRRTNRKGIHG